MGKPDVVDVPDGDPRYSFWCDDVRVSLPQDLRLGSSFFPRGVRGESAEGNPVNLELDHPQVVLRGCPKPLDPVEHRLCGRLIPA